MDEARVTKIPLVDDSKSLRLATERAATRCISSLRRCRQLATPA
jgi:hypothetical protein